MHAELDLDFIPRLLTYDQLGAAAAQQPKNTRRVLRPQVVMSVQE